MTSSNPAAGRRRPWLAAAFAAGAAVLWIAASPGWSATAAAAEPGAASAADAPASAAADPTDPASPADVNDPDASSDHGRRRRGGRGGPRDAHQGRPEPGGGGWWGGRGRGGGGGGGFAQEWLGRFAKGLGPVPTERQWKEVQAFFKKHSPHRLAAFEQLPDSPDAAKVRKKKIQGLVYAHYRHIRKLQKEDPALYEVKLKQIQVEDEVFKILADRRHPSPGEPRLARELLRDPVARMISLGFEERRMRLERRQAALDKQKAKLAADEAESRRNDLVEQRINAMLKPTGRGGPFPPGDRRRDMPPRREGREGKDGRDGGPGRGDHDGDRGPG